jgi:hypothetical protein
MVCAMSLTSRLFYLRSKSFRYALNVSGDVIPGKMTITTSEIFPQVKKKENI